MRVIIFKVQVEFPEETPNDVIETMLSKLENVVGASGYDLYESLWSDK